MPFVEFCSTYPALSLRDERCHVGTAVPTAREGTGEGPNGARMIPRVLGFGSIYISRFLGKKSIRNCDR
jgi:hypothetical protein